LALARTSLIIFKNTALVGLVIKCRVLGCITTESIFIEKLVSPNLFKRSRPLFLGKAVIADFVLKSGAFKEHINIAE
jgi:hypothetical protein